MGKKNVQPFNLETAWPSHRCETIREYLQVAYGKQEQAGHPHAFRGVTDRYSNLWPSFDRRKTPAKNRVKIETDLLEDFIHRAWKNLEPQEKCRFAVSKARWENERNTGALVVARHRQVPTRCVDWTDCPLRSLFFACEDFRESEDNSKRDGEVWWFNRNEFDRCVAAQWPALFRKDGHVEAEIERAFIRQHDEHDKSWFTALKYMRLPDDRLDRQKGWITVAGRLGTCHAERIHRLGVCEKGRLVIPTKLKPKAIRMLKDCDITLKSLGLKRRDRADEIAKQITKKFQGQYDRKKCTASRKPER